MDGDGNDIVFAEYGHARRYLYQRIGQYCSFCERRMQASIAVEHIRSKHANPQLEREWSNFLLACVNCNSAKKEKLKTAEDEAHYLLPHRDRTFDVFDYTAGVVRLAKISDPVIAQRARDTDDLVGLSRTPHRGLTSAQLRGATDTRYRDRHRAYQKARQASLDLCECDTPTMRRRIVDEAVEVGFWSVWMTVFARDPQMCAALCEAFPGTARDRL